MEKNPTVLHENSKGIKIIREDYKKRSKVCVIGFDGTSIRTYRFNNVPEYKHPYLSWENLDHCGGWASDDTYLLSAVHDGKKPAAQYYYGYNSVPKIRKSRDVEVSIKRISDMVYITRTCSLKDLFNIDDIIKAYMAHDIYINSDRLVPYMKKPIMDLMEKRFWINPNDIYELIITGLMLGYPIESTASIIQGY